MAVVEVAVDVKVTTVKFAKNPNVRIGILDKKTVKNWGKRLTSIAQIKVNRMTREDWECKGKKYSTADFLDSIWSDTTLEKDFKEVWSKKGKLLVQEVVADGKEKRALNSAKAIMQQAYLKMSNKGRNSSRRIKAKGHDNYAFGTGQTFKEIRAIIEKEGKKYGVQ